MADLKQIQDQIKIFASKRDQIIGEIGREEGQLENAYAKLRELGVETPEKLTAEQLEEMAANAQLQLNVKTNELETQLRTGEQLLAKYKEIQEN